MPQILKNKAVRGVLSLLGALVVTLIIVSVILLSIGKAPDQIAGRFLDGALGNPNGRADVLMAALPVLMCASGLLLTFTAGLWNIGIEGQMTMGAIFATFIALGVKPTDNSPFIIPAELFSAMVGGALWAALAAILKTKGNINEIFGGVALNFISVNVLLSLINGPWREGQVPQTTRFAPPALLPRLEGGRLSLSWIFIAAIVFLFVYFVLRGTRWGLQLRAMGRSEKSAFLLGVRTERNIVLAMMACGALAGLAGAFQVLFTRGLLQANISGGLGFMGVLVVLLVNVQPGLVPIVSLFFGVVPIGSLKLATSFNAAVQIDASLGNVIQSALVLAVLLSNGIRERWFKPKEPASS